MSKQSLRESNAGAGEPQLVSADLATVHPRNVLNDLTATEWISESVSVWRQRGLGAGHPDAQIERKHPAPFSFTDVSRVIRLLSKRGDVVLDPFVGVGSTLKAAAIEGRRGIGVELNPVFAELTRNRLATEANGSLESGADLTLFEGDAREILPLMTSASVNLVITSPPYWSILHKEDHKARQVRVSHGLSTRYSEADPRDLGNITDYGDFLTELAEVFSETKRLLRAKKHLAIIVGDFRHKGRYHMFHADLASRCEALGFVLKGITILHQTHKRVFPYGYPAAFVPNIHHQYILILRNE